MIHTMADIKVGGLLLLFLLFCSNIIESNVWSKVFLHPIHMLECKHATNDYLPKLNPKQVNI